MKTSKHPIHLVATLSGDDLAELLELARKERPDIIEIRLDHWGAFLKTEFLETLTRYKKKIGLPFLLTFRGSKPLPSWWQAAWWAKLSMIDWIDFEWNPKVDWKPLFTLARQKPLKIIFSTHDYNQTPSTAELNALFQKMKAFKPDLLKCATLAKDESDVHRLLNFSQAWSEKIPVAVMAMGPLATVSRFAAPLYGSSLVYGFMGRPSAKGQMPFGKLREAMRQLYPRYEQAYCSRVH